MNNNSFIYDEITELSLIFNQIVNENVNNVYDTSHQFYSVMLFKSFAKRNNKFTS